ncbi:hypothetical protein AB1Y20_007099 [Prymnesium parvum]|uniref:HAT C-terminal dimerisation domain-containing protein n=1 Tax=Prymnesium parvum TaxID=97485 RepID=A0AB34J2P2_PRYPA
MHLTALSGRSPSACLQQRLHLHFCSVGEAQEAAADAEDTLRDLFEIDFMANLASVAGDTTTVADGEGEEGAIENEARRYLDLPDAPMATDILDWWAKHQTTFPNLSVMAQQYLGVPATSASAERLFSIAGRVFSDLRQGMGDDHLEALMWARINREGRLGA